ncbi:MAG: PilN domain-containing protein [Candidatus Desulfofervidus auxilii]|nr:PilN domain-containing protein [Candidatus Desulfofervidus auxilii]
MSIINLKYPKHVIITLLKGNSTEVVRLKKRPWQKWEISKYETFDVSWPEVLPEVIKGVEREKTAILLLVLRDRYQAHQETYPKAVGEHLENAVRYDLDEVFLSGEDNINFILGKPIETQDNLVVPIFSQTQEQYQLLTGNLEGFLQVCVVPAAQFYPYLGDEVKDCIVLFPMNHRMFEVAIYANGSLRDVFMLEEENIDYFKTYITSIGIENIVCIGSSEIPHFLKGLKIKFLNIDSVFLKRISEYIAKQEVITGWPQDLRLKPSKIVLAYFLLAILLGAYTIYPIFLSFEHKHLIKQVQVVSQELQKTEKQWKPIERVQKEVEELKTFNKKIERIKQEVVSPLKVLKILTEATPNDTWISYFDLKKKTIIIRGESGSVVNFLEVISKVPAFQEVKLLSPVRKKAKTQKELFNIQIKLK